MGDRCGFVRVEAEGRLFQEEGPTPMRQIARARLEYPGGSLGVIARDREMIETLTAIGEASRVGLTGLLRQHHWSTGGGKRHEAYAVEPERLVVIEDARRERMYGGAD